MLQCSKNAKSENNPLKNAQKSFEYGSKVGEINLYPDIGIKTWYWSALPKGVGLKSAEIP